MTDQAQHVWWWGHGTYGTLNVARCNVCDDTITTWTAPWGTNGLPSPVRKQIDKHGAKHEGQQEGQST